MRDFSATRSNLVILSMRRIIAPSVVSLFFAATAMAQDADGDGIPDTSDNCPQVSNPTQSDCNDDGLGDACQTSLTLTTGNMGAIGAGIATTGTLVGVVPSFGQVTLTARAVGDFDLSNEYATLTLAGTTVSATLFQTGANDCPAAPDVAVFVIHPKQWNALVAASSGGNMLVAINGNPLVNPTQCASPFSEVTASFVVWTDCDNNGALDHCDIVLGTAEDCNDNAIPDSCDIASGASSDIDTDGVPDSCQIDCDDNGIPDAYEVAEGTAADCDSNGIPDSCDLRNGAPDCNGNSTPDSCDLVTGSSADKNQDGVPDECSDCNANGTPDADELAQGLLPDCDQNGVPDTCDILAGYDSDCNGDGMLDRCEIYLSLAVDQNQNCVPDSCESALGDFGLDGVVGADDLAFLLSLWGTASASADLSGDGIVGAQDLAIVLSNWGDTPYLHGNCRTLPWAATLTYFVDPDVVTNASLRDAIFASGYPWRVRDNSTQIEMLLVPAGSFAMGCSSSDAFICFSNELPVHTVTFPNGFYIGRYEVTQAEWTMTMGFNPSIYQGAPEAPTRPVEYLSWNTIQGFLAVSGLRLPTEAEWEYACRAGTTTAFHSMPGYPDGTNISALVQQIAWFGFSYPNNYPRPVGGKAANALGLHDMSGNVWEWVSDWFGPFTTEAQTSPAGPPSGNNRVMRGGSFINSSGYVRSSVRTAGWPATTIGSNVGFRVARTP